MNQSVYIKPIKSENIQSLFPGAPFLPPGQEVFALVNSDGTPVVLMDSKLSAQGYALQNNFVLETLH